VSGGEIATLVTAALGGAAHPLAGWYAGLLGDAPPLRAFTAAHASKIRKKARLATTPDAVRDLRCELALAAALAADRRSPLIYEPRAGAGRRGPDFLLRHKGHTEVYVEVSRLRPAQSAERDPADRLAATICGKLGQLVAGAANLLVLVSDDGPFDSAGLAAVITGLRQRADARDDAYFALRGLSGARALHQALLRLSALRAAAPASVSDSLLLQPQARHQIPPDLARAAAGWGLARSIGPASAG
jgi:hypothetical protein